MAVLPLATLPDPVVRTRAKRVRDIDDSVRRLVQDMIDTMRAAHGVGLAAVQIGVPLRVAVIEIPEEDQVRILINPQVLERQGERELEEGCLSIPGYRGQVKRSFKVKVKALDLQGKEVRIKVEDNLLAQALEHEMDHLNGVLYIDHLVSKDSLWKLEEEETTESRLKSGP